MCSSDQLLLSTVETIKTLKGLLTAVCNHGIHMLGSPQEKEAEDVISNIEPQDLIRHFSTPPASDIITHIYSHILIPYTQSPFYLQNFHFLTQYNVGIQLTCIYL